MELIYKICYCIVYPFTSFRYPHRTIGRENIPDGAAVVCANHSSNADPLLVAFAVRKRVPLHFMAKIELFRIPVLGWLLRKAGIIPVDRDKADVTSLKTAMKYLKNGEKVGIFPEGRRVGEGESAEAKTGAVRLAVRMGVPVLPIYVPRSKPLFKRLDLVIGKPYYIELNKKAATNEEYHKATEELMTAIESLRADKI